MRYIPVEINVDMGNGGCWACGEFISGSPGREFILLDPVVEYILGTSPDNTVESDLISQEQVNGCR